MRRTDSSSTLVFVYALRTEVKEGRKEGVAMLAFAVLWKSKGKGSFSTFVLRNSVSYPPLKDFSLCRLVIIGRKGLEAGTSHRPGHRNTIGIKQRAIGVYFVVRVQHGLLTLFNFVSLGSTPFFLVFLRDRILFSLLFLLPPLFLPFLHFLFLLLHTHPHRHRHHPQHHTTTPPCLLPSFFFSFSPPSHPSPSLCKRHRLLALVLFTFFWHSDLTLIRSFVPDNPTRVNSNTNYRAIHWTSISTHPSTTITITPGQQWYYLLSLSLFLSPHYTFMHHTVYLDTDTISIGVTVELTKRFVSFPFLYSLFSFSLLSIYTLRSTTCPAWWLPRVVCLCPGGWTFPTRYHISMTSFPTYVCLSDWTFYLTSSIAPLFGPRPFWHYSPTLFLPHTLTFATPTHLTTTTTNNNPQRAVCRWSCPSSLREQLSHQQQQFDNQSVSSQLDPEEYYVKLERIGKSNRDLDLTLLESIEAHCFVCSSTRWSLLTSDSCCFFLHMQCV